VFSRSPGALSITSVGAGTMLGGSFGGGVDEVTVESFTKGFGESTFARMLGKGKPPQLPPVPVSVSDEAWARVAEPSLKALCGT